jgi:hypothetical protein
MSAGVGGILSVPEFGASDVENDAAGPAVGVTEVEAEEVDDGAAEADSNVGNGKSDS